MDPCQDHLEASNLERIEFDPSMYESEENQEQFANFQNVEQTLDNETLIRHEIVKDGHFTEIRIRNIGYDMDVVRSHAITTLKPWSMRKSDPKVMFVATGRQLNQIR